MITNQFMAVLWTTCRHVTSGKSGNWRHGRGN